MSTPFSNQVPSHPDGSGRHGFGLHRGLGLLEPAAALYFLLLVMARADKSTIVAGLGAIALAGLLLSLSAARHPPSA